MSLLLQTPHSAAPRAASAAPRVLPLLGMHAASACVGSLAGAGLAMFNAWGEGAGPTNAAVLAGLCTLGTAAAVVTGFRAMRFGIVPTKSNPNPTVQPAMLTAMSVARMMASLAVGLACFLIFKPEGKTFWVSFLLGGLLCLLVETAWSVRWMRSMPVQEGDPNTAASPPAQRGGPEVGS